MLASDITPPCARVRAAEEQGAHSKGVFPELLLLQEFGIVQDDLQAQGTSGPFKMNVQCKGQTT